MKKICFLALIKRLLLLTFFVFFLSCSIRPIAFNNEKNSPSLSTKKEVKVNSLKKVAVPAKKKEILKNRPINWSKRSLVKNTPKVSKFCKKINKSFYNLGWGSSRCNRFFWHHVRNSVKGDPLIWVVFGDEKKKKIKKLDTTLILCGVHGDEVTPNKFCFDIIYHLSRNESLYKNQVVIVAPFVNPDSFFSKPRTRTNARGVDLNRNFPTKDWSKNALRLWKKRYRKDVRRYPGKYALSEPGTLFQVNLVLRYRPNKIISIHAPLTMMDYDGPANQIQKSKMAIMAGNLLLQMSEKANGYTIKDYPFFPGSLGNWAGNEKKIPTYTLELPSSDNRKNKDYWKLFELAIHSAIIKDLRKEI